MTDIIEFAVKLTKDDNGTYLVTFPDLPEAITFGDDKHDAMKRAVECLDTLLAHKMKQGEEIPAAKKKGGAVITPSPRVATKALLYKAAKKDKVSKAELARRLNWKYPQVDRLFNPYHASHIGQMTAAYEALGKRMVIGIEDIR